MHKAAACARRFLDNIVVHCSKSSLSPAEHNPAQHRSRPPMLARVIVYTYAVLLGLSLLLEEPFRLAIAP
jgi:hypothetical protein